VRLERAGLGCWLGFGDRRGLASGFCPRVAGFPGSRYDCGSDVGAGGLVGARGVVDECCRQGVRIT
jgi:hypothetical protein